MGSRRPKGYEYRHRFWTDDSVVPAYDEDIEDYKPTVDKKRFLFEIQTSFKLRKIAVDEEEEEEEMGSERFAANVPYIDDSYWLEHKMSGRLAEYLMSEDEIVVMVFEALDFAQQEMLVDGGAKYKYRSVVSVVVGLDVCTVQKEGESIDAAKDRAVLPERLFPLNLCYFPTRKGDEPEYDDEESFLFHKRFLMRLPRYRPDEDVGLARMEECDICSRDFPAAQVSYLPCGHAFHSHCVFQWFYEGKSSCATCGDRVPEDLLEGEFSDGDSVQEDLDGECSDDDDVFRRFWGAGVPEDLEGECSYDDDFFL